MLVRIGMRCAVMVALVLGATSVASAADDGVWSVGKSSGEVWLATSGAQQVSLNQEETLKPGDTIRTGRNGRVLLVRGEETILISPNSVVGVPAEKKEGLSTTIIQQAGSILLEVEKRNVKHFEVETPYLAAVVKGTHFSVTVGAGSTKVGVLRGQVEVSDFKTGQIAQVMPGQVATAFAHGKSGLSLSGSGTLNPIEQGKPRASTIDRVPVPKSGLSAPRDAANGHAIHALGKIEKGIKVAGVPMHQPSGTHAPKPGIVRISNSLGEVKLNFHTVTHGLAHSAVAPGRVRNANASTGTVWSDGKSSTTTTTSNSSSVTAVTVSGSGSAAAGSSTSSSATTNVATSAGSTSDVPGNSGTPKSKSDKGNDNSAANNSAATGNGKGNNGNGGGNGSNGNGNGNGHHH
ncbi:FecR domain-containing protein [Bradyrhizobium sp. BR 10261]|uniref:FecR family protein n=1 Tax=Bradyrhizobium sp. BR 10261 TaxID=2749992 RepID=UPI001C650FC8|nr:FecR family protein [Bradyrhizobium sp. BR 10261]MBW7961229.1 FecR domain-containing protein [Bradyrhizobium sp. BR 10261]